MCNSDQLFHSWKKICLVEPIVILDNSVLGPIVTATVTGMDEDTFLSYSAVSIVTFLISYHSCKMPIKGFLFIKISSKLPYWLKYRTHLIIR